MSLSEHSTASPMKKKRIGLGSIAMVFACGTSLFADGYVNGIVGEINTILRRLYPQQYADTNYSTLFSSMGFAGTVVGMLSFGYFVDRFGRKSGMLASSAFIIVFVALSAGAYGAGGSTTGLLQALIAYRFLAGIGIGGEYPCGSVSCSEATEEPGINPKIRHLLFGLATNSAIDIGFVVAAFVPLVCIWIFSEDHLRAVWRVSYGLGLVPAIAILAWRLAILKEPTTYRNNAIKRNVPYLLVFKRYWRSILRVSLAWWIYDFIASSESFMLFFRGLFSSEIVDTITGGSTKLTTVFAWNIVINAFYLPGTIGGSFLLDWLGPKKQIIIFLCLQGVVGFIMSGLYERLSQNVAPFAVVYGIFLSLGEAGPGLCLGLLASKSWPTAVRGQLYGFAAAIGKVGTWCFPEIIAAFPEGPKQTSGPFWIGSSLAIFSAIVVFVLVPEVKTDHMQVEDALFKEYLQKSGYDISQMGLLREGTIESQLRHETSHEEEKKRVDSF
ncbi:uncharacterized protein JCM6883_005978 [Sporobolomyces salmoneus]|uniref:uncharacterized protein n=1 Tax=Sporobolomyces salmoneus TaxID=183962 RepID=UPI0031762D36